MSPAITTNEPRPLFADLGEMARAITEAIRRAAASGIAVTEVAVNPHMKELMDQMKGERILMIGNLPVSTDERIPIDKFALKKAPGFNPHTLNGAAS